MGRESEKSRGGMRGEGVVVWGREGNKWFEEPAGTGPADKRHVAGIA